MKEKLVHLSRLHHVSRLTQAANYTIAALRKANGTMTLEDLRNYDVSVRKTISINYRGYKLYSTGAPSSGSVALSMLKIIEGYNMGNLDLRDLNTHRLDEAMRYSYAARGELGDPDFFNNIEAFEAQMLKPTTAEHIRARISDYHTRNVSEYDPKGYALPENHGTSHIVTTDASGMSITLTTTVNLLFGSHLMVPETGDSTFNLCESLMNDTDSG
jgi:gamma-glutamyltranspeptidase / glutathione hydrolase